MIMPYAAADTQGNAILRMNGNPAMASLVWHTNVPTSEISVQTMAVDFLIADLIIPEPQFVKIDVEGAENKVLAGMINTVTRLRPLIFLECSENGRHYTWEVLGSLGYKCYSAKTRAAVGRVRTILACRFSFGFRSRKAVNCFSPIWDNPRATGISGVSSSFRGCLRK